MSDAFAQFFALWGSDYHPPVKLAPSELAGVETKLGFLFPQSYVSAMGTCGAFSTRIELLNTIVDRNIDMRDINEFLNPAEIEELKIGWQEAGMPEGLIPFAKDSMGNLFCFDEEDGQTVRKPDGPIYFWDHDFNEVDQEAESFDKWISRYNAIADRR